ncbi:MAG: FG-GAP repeat protein [Planctomycetes bacterium]|nr:FG-GAP repeat protein [Planctomycetota bacterium]
MNQVKSSGDVNGDGLDDFAIAEIGGRWDINNPGVFRPGRVFIIYGEAGSTRFRRGDSNADGTVDQSDAVYTLMALFLGGDQPECLDAADADDSGALDITDAVYSLLWEFRGGPEPPPPEPMACGADPTADELGCSTPPLCK